jgi:type II secretory pathway pseudopilin PulG
MLRSLPRFTRALTLTAVPALGLFMAAGSIASASASTTHAAHVQTAAQREAAARAALEHMLSTHPTAHLVGHGIHSNSVTKVDSTNWSGYANTGTGYTKVSGSWTEPTVKCPSSGTAIAAYWVGIDGYSSDSVEQDGTLAYCDAGSLTNYSWWEMYPTNSVQLVGSTVKAGDKITGSVVRTGTKYALKVTDSTTSGNNVSKSETCAASSCKDTSAEWIVERPSGSGGLFVLPDFGTAKFTASSQTSSAGTGTISKGTADEITMVRSTTSKVALAVPTALTDSGADFNVTWKASK